MTTAHRPTWNAAKGGSEQGGNLLVNPTRNYSAKDLPANTAIKYRVPLVPQDFKQSIDDNEKVLGKREAPQELAELIVEVENPFD